MVVLLLLGVFSPCSWIAGRQIFVCFFFFLVLVGFGFGSWYFILFSSYCVILSVVCSLLYYY